MKINCFCLIKLIVLSTPLRQAVGRTSTTRARATRNGPAPTVTTCATAHGVCSSRPRKRWNPSKAITSNLSCGPGKWTRSSQNPQSGPFLRISPLLISSFFFFCSVLLPKPLDARMSPEVDRFPRTPFPRNIYFVSICFSREKQKNERT